MRKKHDSISRKERTLRCPVCHALTGATQDGRAFGVPPEFRPNPGDITECACCQTMLEHCGDPNSLTLRVARRERVELFRQLMRERPEPELPELVEYVMKFRQMPQRPPFGYRLR
jgi:hypothetical protein